MNYGSVCSGIEAATEAWEPLGWKAAFFSEIEAFPSAVLKHHYPDTPNLGDMTKFKEWPDASINVLVGGTPCQSFSVAGLRKGLADPRGNLMLTYGAIAGRYRPLWLVWENVPGVLSSNGGKDFGTFLGMLAELGYGFAYRVLDAQYFGIPQRRRRVFVVGYFGDWRPAAAVLFERHSLSGNSAPSREKGERVAPTVASGPPYSRTGNERVECEALIPLDVDRVVPCLDAQYGSKQWASHNDMNHGHSHLVCMETGQGNAGIGTTLNCNHEVPIVAQTRERVCVCRMREGKDGGGKGPLISDDVSLTLATGNDQVMAVPVAFQPRIGRNGRGYMGDHVNALNTESGRTGKGDSAPCVAFQSPTLKAECKKGDTELNVMTHSQVRRLTPRECERLQGFPDDYTLIPWRGKPAEQCPDGPRYKVLGNSMAVPVMYWLGQRIEQVDRMLREGK